MVPYFDAPFSTKSSGAMKVRVIFSIFNLFRINMVLVALRVGEVKKKIKRDQKSNRDYVLIMYLG